MIVQFCIAGHFARAVDGNASPPANATPPPRVHIFPEDIQAILRKVQTCVDLPVCEDRDVPREAQLSFRAALPADCRLSRAEEQRLSEYFSSVRAVSPSGALAQTLGGLALLTLAIIPIAILINSIADNVQQTQGVFVGTLTMLAGAIVTTGVMTPIFLLGNGYMERQIPLQTLHRAYHALGVSPENVERALARIPRQSWLKRTFSLAATRNGAGPRATRVEAAVNRLAIQTPTPTQAPNSSAGEVPRETIREENSAGDAVTSTSVNTNTATTEPTGVRVCVPSEVARVAANVLADETLAELEAAADAAAGSPPVVGGRGRRAIRMATPTTFRVRQLPRVTVAR